jgi:hypothetical protein
MLDVFYKGSLKDNGVCISELRKDNSSSYPKLVESEAKMQKMERSKEPKTKAPLRPPEMAPLSSFHERLDVLMPTTTGSYPAPDRAPLALLSRNLDRHGTSRSNLKDSSESSNAPAAFRVKGRKRLQQEPSSDEEDENDGCAAASPEY